MAVEAPAHAEGRHLRDRFHLVDAAVAGDAADSRRDMRVVGEMGVVGQLVDANPAHRPAAGGAVANRCELLAVPLHDLMAVHAGLGGRHVRDGRNLDRGVAVSAIETKLADVELVAVGDGLNRTVAHICVPRGKAGTRCPRSRAPERGCRRRRRRSGACSTKEGRSGSMARAPERRRVIALAASTRWNCDDTSSRPQTAVVEDRDPVDRGAILSTDAKERQALRPSELAIDSEHGSDGGPSRFGLRQLPMARRSRDPPASGSSRLPCWSARSSISWPSRSIGSGSTSGADTRGMGSSIS